MEILKIIAWTLVAGVLGPDLLVHASFASAVDLGEVLEEKP